MNIPISFPLWLEVEVTAGRPTVAAFNSLATTSFFKRAGLQSVVDFSSKSVLQFLDGSALYLLNLILFFGGIVTKT
jgi:hypothetical protein